MATGGYTMDVAVTESAATALSNDASYAKSAVSALTAIPKIGAPAAGEGIGSTLTKFQSGWDEALGKIGTEMKDLSGKVSGTAKATVKVERDVQDRFGHFAN
jgi:hypothetical protein